MEKQYNLLKIVVDTYYRAKKLVEKSIAISQILPSELVSKLLTMKEEISNLEDFEKVEAFLKEHFDKLDKTYA